LLLQTSKNFSGLIPHVWQCSGLAWGLLFFLTTGVALIGFFLSVKLVIAGLNYSADLD
jgi:hypothetical protein